jgi:hypothetical protein
MADRPGGNTETRVKGLIPLIFQDQLRVASSYKNIILFSNMRA